MDLGNISALRTFRVLRALKTITVIPGTGGAGTLCAGQQASPHAQAWNLTLKFQEPDPGSQHSQAVFV